MYMTQQIMRKCVNSKIRKNLIKRYFSFLKACTHRWMSDRLHNKGGGDGGRNGTQATVAWHGMAWWHHIVMNIVKWVEVVQWEQWNHSSRLTIKMKVMIRHAGVNGVVKIILLKAYWWNDGSGGVMLVLI